jgi:hypothetical protein
VATSNTNNVKLSLGDDAQAFVVKCIFLDVHDPDRRTAIGSPTEGPNPSFDFHHQKIVVVEAKVEEEVFKV